MSGLFSGVFGSIGSGIGSILNPIQQMAGGLAGVGGLINSGVQSQFGGLGNSLIGGINGNPSTVQNGPLSLSGGSGSGANPLAQMVSMGGGNPNSLYGYVPTPGENLGKNFLNGIPNVPSLPGTGAVSSSLKKYGLDIVLIVIGLGLLFLVFRDTKPGKMVINLATKAAMS